MDLEQTRAATPDAASTAPVRAGASSRAQLRGMSYEQGRQQLSPNPQGPAQLVRQPRGLPGLDAANPARQVDDAEVRLMIRQLFADNPGRTLHETVYTAWQDANYRRNRHGQDMNLCAAEHYLWARSEAHGGGAAEVLTHARTWMYERAKRLLPDGARRWLSSDGTDPTPANDDVERWGHRGADAGGAEADVANQPGAPAAP